MLDTHGRHGGPKKLTGDQVQVFLTSSTRPPRHFGPKDGKRSSPTRFGGWIRTAEKASTCDGRHGRIRTRIGPFKYFVESLSSLLSNGSNLTSISVRSQPQSSILYRDVFCPRCCVILFWPNGSCIKLSPLWMHPRVGARP